MWKLIYNLINNIVQGKIWEYSEKGAHVHQMQIYHCISWESRLYKGEFYDSSEHGDKSYIHSSSKEIFGRII